MHNKHTVFVEQLLYSIIDDVIAVWRNWR